MLVAAAPAYAAGAHMSLVAAGILGDIFGGIGHAVLGAISWTFNLASQFFLVTIGALVKLLIPRSWAQMLLALCGFGASRPARTFADLLVAAPLALVTIQVGLALDRWGARLLPYIPQLPIEYAAAALAAGVWITYRHSPRPAVRALARDTGLMLALLAIAATVEVLATPHGP